MNKTSHAPFKTFEGAWLVYVCLVSISCSSMASLVEVFVFLLLICSAQSTAPVIPDEDWGYVDVRTSAHMFWWLYGCTDSAKDREHVPLVMWLQVNTLPG